MPEEKDVKQSFICYLVLLSCQVIGGLAWLLQNTTIAAPEYSCDPGFSFYSKLEAGSCFLWAIFNFYRRQHGGRGNWPGKKILYTEKQSSFFKAMHKNCPFGFLDIPAEDIYPQQYLLGVWMAPNAHFVSVHFLKNPVCFRAPLCSLCFNLFHILSCSI